MDGKMAVAQCIKDAMLQDNISAVTVQSKYGYAGWKTDLESTYPEDWVEVLEAIERVFDQGENITDENILWFYAPKYTTSKWHESQKYVGTYGTQRFFAPWNWKEGIGMKILVLIYLIINAVYGGYTNIEYTIL